MIRVTSLIKLYRIRNPNPHQTICLACVTLLKSHLFQWCFSRNQLLSLFGSFAIVLPFISIPNPVKLGNCFNLQITIWDRKLTFVSSRCQVGTVISNPHNIVRHTAARNTKEIGWLAAKFSGRVGKCNNTTTTTTTVAAAFGWWQVLISQPSCFHNARPVLNII